MYKHIITYRFSGTENDPDYQKRRGEFLRFLQQHDFFEVDTMDTIFVKSDEDPTSLFLNLEIRMKEAGCPFKDDDEVMILMFHEDENGRYSYHGSGKLNDGELVPDADFEDWLR